MTGTLATPSLVYSKNQIIKDLELDIAPKPRPQLSLVKNAPARGLPPEMFKVCKDGERTQHLTVLAGKLINQRRPLSEVIQLAGIWNQKNSPPLDDGKVEATCNGIWKTHGSNHQSSDQELAATPLFDINDAKVTQFLAEEPPKRRWLLKECLPFGKVGAVIATGGTGKSQFLLQLGVSVATGVDFLRWIVPEAGGVLILAAEDDTEELHRRLVNIHQEFAAYRDTDLEFTNRLNQNLHIKSMVAEDNMMTRVYPGGREIEQTPYVERLVLTARQINNLKLIVIDPASRFRGGEENTAQDTTRFIEALERVREQTGATVLVAHHTNKGSQHAEEQSQGAARGSSAFSDGLRWQMNLAKPTKNEAENLLGIDGDMRHLYLKAEIVKNNYAAPSEPTFIRRREGGYLEKADIDPTGLTQNDTQLLAAIKTRLRTEAKAGALLSQTRFVEIMGGQNGVLKIGQVALRKKLKAFLASGELKLVKGKLDPDTPIPS